jgi:hypothetical protein
VKSLVAAACLGAALLLAPRAQAQTPNNQISFSAVMKAPVGAWAEYLMTRDEHERPVRVRYTLAERSAKAVAIELDSATPEGHVLVRMDYVADGPSRYRLERARMKMPDGKLQVLPTPAGSHGQGAGFGKGDAFGQSVGKESIRVGAGTFQAEHWKQAGTEVWMDDKALPVGLVKLTTGGDGPTVELVAMGKGGKSGF